MNNTVITFVASTAFALFGVMAGAGSYGVVEGIVSKPEPYGLQLVTLKYKDGKFHQRVKPINTEVVRAKWAAKITREGEILCSGGGVGIYQDKEAIMNENIWTGDNCPSLKSGDLAIASWTYETVDGYNVTISGEVKIGS